MVLKNLKPQDVFTYFEKLTKISRGSYHTEAVREYLRQFADEFDLNMEADAKGNVIIGKAGSPGREAEDPVIIQGHMDIVNVKDDGVEIDFLKDPLEIEVNGDIISAKGTSLGADNGIAVAYMLALLSRMDISHPPLECVFTTDEEVGLQGAEALNVSSLRGRRMINIDSEEEGHLLTGCAGGIKLISTFPANWQLKSGGLYEINITGLSGGHSGIEIDKGRGNANVLMGRILKRLLDAGADLVSINGGYRDNVIPSSAKAVLLYHEVNSNKLKDMIYTARAELKKEYELSDPNLEIDIVSKGMTEINVCAPFMKDRIIMYLRMAPDGVVGMSKAIPGLVETSLNMGIVTTTEEGFIVRHAMRSSVKSKKTELFRRLKSFAEYMGARTSSEGDYPPWEYRNDSPLRDQMGRVYEEMYGVPMKIEMIHAGLECGYLSDKIPGLDCVSIGPDIRDAHTTRESMSISSAIKVWEYLLRVLEEI